MKKSDILSWVVSISMIGVALLVGFLVVRPLLSDTDFVNALPFGSGGIFLLTILFIVAAIIFNAVLVELGHLLGAKVGHYSVSLFVIFGLGVKRNAKGHYVFGLFPFDGLTGETRIVPKDVKKSNASSYIVFPLVFFLIEVIICVLAMALGLRYYSVTKSVGWIRLLAIIFLAVGGMIYLYNSFPAQLDATTDGYRMTLLSRPINKVAYNVILLANDRLDHGQSVESTPVYDEVTDFTAQINNITMYNFLGQGDYDSAISILDKTIACEKNVSVAVFENALSEKLSLFFVTKDLSSAKSFYDTVRHEDRKYISQVSDLSSLRCYLLISGLVDESEAEANFALSKAEKAAKKVPAAYFETEKKLLTSAIEKVKTAHPDWTLEYQEIAPTKEQTLIK